jgi:A1 cistron-splicing factor AAR2
MEEKEDDVLPHLKPVPGTELRFTQFPERHFPEGSTPAEITHHSLDSTYVLETMVAKYTRCVFFLQCGKTGLCQQQLPWLH